MTTRGSFFAELKRRNVFRVGIAYVVTAWLVAQIADLVLDNIESPAWVMQTLMLLLALGLPFALIFAWAYELTPEGLKKEREVDRTQSITPQTGRKLDYAIIGVLTVALFYFAVDKFVLQPSQHASPSATEELAGATVSNKSTAPAQKSIAVLPFVNMSEEASNEYFSDGISEEILNALARVRDLKVAGRTSSFAFKGQSQDLRRIGEALGVEHILEGSVRKAGNKIRITAQLIQVEDGFHLWSDTYDRELTDVFAIQDEIASAILAELKTQLLGGESADVVATRTNAEAYDLYLLAKQRMYERTRLALESAAELLDRAISLDPAYAPAYAQRGITSLLLSSRNYGTLPHDESLAQGKRHLDQALVLDERLAEAWAGLGLFYSDSPARSKESIAALEKALAINPNLIDASNWLSQTYQSVNRGADALALLDDIVERDPLYKPAIGNRSYQLAAMGRGDEARAAIDRLEPFLPDDPQLLNARAVIDYVEGQLAHGLELGRMALEKQPDNRVYKESVNRGAYHTHQYDLVTDDQLTGDIIWALFNLGRNEEAMIVARARADDGIVGPLFAFLNASGHPEVLIEYLEARWPDLAAFEKEVPAPAWGYREMADVAFAYRALGNQARFEEAMARFEAANQKTLEEGVRDPYVLLFAAAGHAMAGEHQQALARLAEAIDGGLILSTRISREFPHFREMEGDPEYEAIQARMIEHLNRERVQLGLEPVSA